MLLHMAWRNLWRNRRRTVVTLSALTLGVTAVVFLHSYRESMYAAIVSDITTGLVGDLQVHGKGYQADPDIATVVSEPERVEASVGAALPGVQAVQRVIGYGLAAVGETSTAALVVGIQPDRERRPRPLLVIQQGRDLSDAPAKEAVLGRDLALQLEASPGAEVVLVGQGADGSLANDRYTVVGIADAGSSGMNAEAVFLHIASAQDLFGLGGSVHELIVRSPSAEEDPSELVATLRGALDLRTLEVLSWAQILPEFKATMQRKRRQQHIVDLVVILIVGLGVLNAMTMSTFERTREFGVLASLGTRRSRILSLILTEALLQGLLGCLAGIALAIALLYGIGSVGLTALSQQDMLGVRLPPLVHLKVEWQGLVSAVVTAFVTVLAGGGWPALRASRLKPVEATRYV